MSRKVNPSDPNLSDEDRAYLRDRGTPTRVTGVSAPRTERPAPAPRTEPETKPEPPAAPVPEEDNGQTGNDDGYDDLSHDDLKTLIDERNEGRDKEDRISKAGSSAVLIERLREDDAETIQED